MTLISMRDIHKSFGTETVFRGLNLQIHPGQRAGLIGPNGSGKTTLFRMLLDDLQPDIGQITKSNSLRIGYLSQRPDFDPDKTVLDILYEGLTELSAMHKKMDDAAHRLAKLAGDPLKDAMADYDRLCHRFELAGGYSYETRVKCTLAGLGIPVELFDTKIAALSGGQRCRVALAQVLLKQTDLLLLDEPTNHLDLQATEWLEKFLITFEGSVVIVSHDRYLLDRVAQRIIELDNKHARCWKGNYSQYIQEKEIASLELQRRYEQRSEMVARTLDFIARNKDQEGMRKTARGRKTRLNRMLKENPDFLDKPTQQKTITFSFSDAQTRSELALRAENLGKSFGVIRLFEGLTFDVYRGQRLLITGPNGTGKSTLLKLALGEFAPDSGKVAIGKNLKIGYLDQHSNVLAPDKTVFEEAASVRPDLTPEQLRGRLGAFLFSGDDIHKRIENLSGGQQNRLIIVKIVLSEPDILIMDEPTNHLDIPTRQMLEQALTDYSGTIIAVSHDRYFIDSIADRLLVLGCDPMGEKKMCQYEFVEAFVDQDGVWTAYTERIKKRQQEAQEAAPAKKETRPGKKPKTAAPEELKAFNRFSVEQIEQKIAELETQIKQLEEKYADPVLCRNLQLLTELKTNIEDKKAQLDLHYRAWEYKIANCSK